MSQELSEELRIINTDTFVFQLKYLNLDHYDKKELEELHETITNKIKNSDEEESKTKARTDFQNKIKQQIYLKNGLEPKLEFETDDSYLVFKILSEYFEKRTKLATSKLTWENIWEYEEFNSLQVLVLVISVYII